MKPTSQHLAILSLFVTICISANCGAEGGAAKPSLALSCEKGISFSDVKAEAAQITFKQGSESTQAKLNAMSECKDNAGKFFCYHANSETMINIPLNIGSKHKNDQVTVYINDDADDVHGNGKPYKCTVVEPTQSS